MTSTAEPLLRAVTISKRFGAIQALHRVSLDIHAGDVIGVVGDTNSGKSTLLRLLAGGLSPDEGTFSMQGRPVRLDPAHRAARLGIKAVYQDINAADHMSALAYIFAAQAPTSRGPLRWLGWWNQASLAERAQAEFTRLGFAPPPLDCPLHDLTGAQRKMVAFVAATIWTPRLLLLDEPIDALEAFRAHLLDLIRAQQAQGTAVLLVTQNLDDIFSVADRIVVLNAGSKIAERRTAETTAEEIVSLILGSVEDRLTPAVWALSNYFEVRRQAEELDRLYKALERRAARLQAHAEVAASATSILDSDKLITQIVRIIRQRFGYNYAGLFLVEAGNKAIVLRGSASRSGQHLDQLRLPLSGDGMVAWCAAHGQAHLAHDVTQDPLYEPESTLPNTRSELVLPLRIGRRVLGVLDLQSDRLNAFDEEDVQTLQALADQLAIAIRNAELYESAQIARQQADEANRYKSVFLSNMSHELRTPLSVIIGHTQAMLSPTSEFYRTPLPPEYVRDLETIRKSGAHLLALINDVLDLSKIEAGKLRLRQAVIDLKDILDDTLRTGQGLLQGRPVVLRAAYPATLPPVWCDSVRTRQIVLNLLTNAIKFTEHGSITVQTTVREDVIEVAVQDTGVGIPAHLLGAMFERFRQGDPVRSRKYGGTGLGLSISQQLVELQGGQIGISSTVGAGTTVWFTVPRATSAQIAAERDRPREDALLDEQRLVIFQPAGHPSPQRLILLAQDERANTHALAEALEAAGYVVEYMPVDDVVVEMTEVMLPDVVILDASEPRGQSLLARLRAAAAAAAIPIILFTAQDPGPGPSDPRLYCIAHDQVTPAVLVQLVRACLAPHETPHPDGPRTP